MLPRSPKRPELREWQRTRTRRLGKAGRLAPCLPAPPALPTEWYKGRDPKPEGLQGCGHAQPFTTWSGPAKRRIGPQSLYDLVDVPFQLPISSSFAYKQCHLAWGVCGSRGSSLSRPPQRDKAPPNHLRFRAAPQTTGEKLGFKGIVDMLQAEDGKKFLAAAATVHKFVATKA